MPTDPNDTAQLRRDLLDRVEKTLGRQDLSPEARQEALDEFERALQEAGDNPKSTADVLAEWQDSSTLLREQLDAMQKNGDMSATELADMSRNFDAITDALSRLQQEPANHTGTSTNSASAPLPQGMPQELADKLTQKPDV